MPPLQSSPGQFTQRDAHGCFNHSDLLLIVSGDERAMEEDWAGHGPVS